MSFAQGFSGGFGAVHGGLARNVVLAQQQPYSDAQEMENTLNRPYVEEMHAIAEAERQRGGDRTTTAGGGGLVESRMSPAAGGTLADRPLGSRPTLSTHPLGGYPSPEDEGSPPPGGRAGPHTPPGYASNPPPPPSPSPMAAPGYPDTPSAPPRAASQAAPGAPPSVAGPPAPQAMAPPAQAPAPVPGPPAGPPQMPPPGYPPEDDRRAPPVPTRRAPVQGAVPAATPGGTPSQPAPSGPAPGSQQWAQEADEGTQTLRTVADMNGVRPDQVNSGHWARMRQAAERNMAAPMAQRFLEQMERRQVAVLQRGTALAAAAIEANDWAGAARALNSLNPYAPDGHNDVFVPTANGLRLTRTPDAGGEPQTTEIPAQQARAYVMSMLDPKWWQDNVFRNRQQTEVERRNRADEGLRGGALAVSRGELSLRERDFNARRSDVGRAHELDDADRAATARLTEAYAAMRADPTNAEAQQAYAAALAGAPLRAIQGLEGVENAATRAEAARTNAETRREQAAARTEYDAARTELARARAAGEAEKVRAAQQRIDIAERNLQRMIVRDQRQGESRPLTRERLESLQSAIDSVFPAEASRNAPAAAPAARQFAVQWGGDIAAANPNLTDAGVAQVVQQVMALPTAEARVQALSSGMFNGVVIPPNLALEVRRRHEASRTDNSGAGGGTPPPATRTPETPGLIGRALAPTGPNNITSQYRQNPGPANAGLNRALRELDSMRLETTIGPNELAALARKHNIPLEQLQAAAARRR